MTRFNGMMEKVIFLNRFYPSLDIRPVRNYFCYLNYDIIWYHDFPNCHVGVLKENDELILQKPDPNFNFYVNLKFFSGMFSRLCSDEFWKHLMRDVVRHFGEGKVLCGDLCENPPLCSQVFNNINNITTRWQPAAKKYVTDVTD